MHTQDSATTVQLAANTSWEVDLLYSETEYDCVYAALRQS